jgi:hypothetical protein
VASPRKRTRNTLADQHAAGLDTVPIQCFQHGQDLAPPPVNASISPRTPEIMQTLA